MILRAMNKHFMRLILKFFFLISLVLLIFTGLALFDAYTSLKYEVDEPKAMQKISDALNEREKLLENHIIWLWIFFSYEIMNIVISCYLLISKNIKRIRM